jgi:hypothetical protein
MEDLIIEIEKQKTKLKNSEDLYTSLRHLFADLSSLIDASNSSLDEKIFSSQLLRLDASLKYEKKCIDKLKHSLDRLEKILQIHFDRDLEDGEDDEDQEASDV